MTSRMSFDEFNNLSPEEISEQKVKKFVKEYFDVMDLPESEKKKREELSIGIYEVMLFIFSLFSAMLESGYVDDEYLLSELKKRYKSEVSKYIKDATYLNNYIDDFCEQAINTTVKHVLDRNDTSYNDDLEENYYLSQERALVNGVNEGNSIFNQDDYINAKDSGKKTKTWISERDERVRKTHLEADSQTVLIDEPFVVGDSLLLYPKDTSLGASASEIVNCRCTVIYN